MRMIVAGGGTGGHLFPGLAVAEALAPADVAVFVGSADGLEARVVPNTRFAFYAIPIHAVRGRGLAGLLDLARNLPRAMLQGWRLIGEVGAQVVVGVGGYASFPTVTAAWLRGVPSVVLEQNARPGLANRVLGRLAARVCTAFEQANASFPAGKAVVTGNPVRAFGMQREAAVEHRGFTLFVFGGSRGAHSINAAMLAAAPGLREAIPGLRIIHQTGVGVADEPRARYAALGIDAEVAEFIEDMGRVYGEADLVVCRAGATTIAELTALGKPAIFVPYPFAADDHQRANAVVLAERGAGVMVEDGGLDGGSLEAAIIEIAGDAERRAAMADSARRLGKPQATQHVIALCRELAGEVVDE
jgi:UDP-N-acetylglucosamine--N-acetylmuramyl-(pentapeptide) pyrophosphoryl-undecaprenol N-acetylglucosamine transferase